MHRGWSFRCWAIVWAVLQFALPTAASFADARLEREASGAQGPHVEARSTAACHPVHAAECPLCQVVSRASSPAVGNGSFPAIESVIEQPAVAGQLCRELAGSPLLSLARAPPLS